MAKQRGLSQREREILAANLVAARERMKWSVTYAAGRARIAISQLSLWENAKREPELLGLFRLAVAYRCRMDDFFGGVKPEYDAIIEAPIPPDVRRHYEARVERVMLQLAESLRQARAGEAPERTLEADDDEALRAADKSSPTRARRKRRK